MSDAVAPSEIAMTDNFGPVVETKNSIGHQNDAQYPKEEIEVIPEDLEWCGTKRTWIGYNDENKFRFRVRRILFDDGLWTFMGPLSCLLWGIPDRSSNMTLGYVCCFGLMPLKLALAGLYLFICFFADVLRAVFWLLTVGCCLQKCWFIGPCRGKRRHRDCCERRAKCCTLYPVALNPTEVIYTMCNATAEGADHGSTSINNSSVVGE